MTLTSATSAQAVVNHHLERFLALDLPGVVADYAPDAVMIVPTGVLRGLH
jgi:ketosteroid isomerase-like protein